jgi:hypothetical protein
MPEIRFTLTEKLDKLISKFSDELGVPKSDYIKSLILTDLKKSFSCKENLGKETQSKETQGKEK